MALTPAEKQRRFRERQKEREKAAPDLSMAVTDRPFSQFLKERESNFMLPENLHWVGVELMTDLTEERPKIERAADWEELGLHVNALTVASAMVGIFTDAAKELSDLINEYKLEEIDRQMPKASPVKRLQLEHLRKRLSKRTSYFLPVIEVKGD